MRLLLILVAATVAVSARADDLYCQQASQLAAAAYDLRYANPTGNYVYDALKAQARRLHLPLAEQDQLVESIPTLLEQARHGAATTKEAFVQQYRRECG